MSKEEEKNSLGSVPPSTPLSASARPANSLGTGSRSPSGTISLDSTPTPSYDELALKKSSQDDDQEESSERSRTQTADAALTSQSSSSEQVPAPTLQRVYSEEDEELRKAKAMALAIQQHPNMTPDEIHELHIGDEAQSHIIEETTGAKPKSDFFESIRESQKKTKELFSSMVKTTTTTTSSSTPSREKTAAATPTSSIRTTASQDSSSNKAATVDKTPVISPAAVVKRAADKAPTPKQVAKAVQEKAGPVITAVQQGAPPSTSSSKKKYPVMNAAKAKATSAANKAKAKANSAKEAIKKTRSSGSTSPPTPSKQDMSRSAPPSTMQVPSDIVDLASMNVKQPTLSTSTTEKVIEQEPSDSTSSENKIRLTADVWKRRGGMGKLSYSKAWERRRVVLQGNRLFYFKIPEKGESSLELERKPPLWFDQAAQALDKGKWLGSENDPSAPRGYFDLQKEQTTVAASSGHSGAPSPFAISIKVKADTIWKLCFDDHATQMTWLAALTDLVVTSSVDSYNANLLLAADPSHEATMFDAEYQPPPGDKEAGQQLWMMSPYRVSSLGLEEQGQRHVVVTEAEPETTTTSASLDEMPDVDRWIFKEQDVRALFVIVNAALILSRSSSTTPQQFWYVLTFCNLALGYYLMKGYKKRDTSSAPAVVAASGLIKSIVDIEEQVATEEEEEEITGEKPVAGTTTVKLQNPTDSPEINGQVFGAWCAPAGECLAVRSHGYLTSKEKIPSPGELYELVNVDIFESPHRYPDMARRVKLPEVEFEGEDPSSKTWYAPDIFIVSVALPTDPPKMRQSNDGGGFTITMYFAMRQETRDILRRVTAESYDPLQEPTPEDVQKSKVNAVKLFNEYCRRAPSDPSFQGRFKLVANAQNLKEIGMPNWISKYNGKPVLIKRAGQTGFLYSHPKLSCMEFDVSFHPFPYLAKQAISYMKDNFFKKVLVTFGFVIEGRSDDELPECVIGLMQLCYPDPVYAIQASDFFAGKSPRSF